MKIILFFMFVCVCLIVGCGNILILDLISKYTNFAPLDILLIVSSSLTAVIAYATYIVTSLFFAVVIVHKISIGTKRDVSNRKRNEKGQFV